MRGRSELLRRVLALLWGAGGGAGLFLLLCAGGVVDPASLRTPEPPPEEAAAVFARTEPAPFRAASLEVEDLDRAKQAAKGRDGVVITVKGPDGRLAWVSNQPMAVSAGASFPLPARNEALRAMNATPGLYTVAKVACLRDDALTRACPALALERVSGSPWRDGTGGGWLDPGDQSVRTYYIGLCRELADLGFDEILLTDCRYPAGAEPGDLAGPADRGAALETFCRRLEGALADLPVVLSVEGAAKGDGVDPDSGQTPALLASFSGRVWAREEDAAALAAFHPAVVPAG